MSPQSALRVRTASFSSTVDCGRKREINMSNSELAQAADASFSMHKRLDSELEETAVMADNPLDHAHSGDLASRFQLRKRKVSISSTPQECMSNYNVDFLSGIFQDIAKANAQVSTVEGEGDSHPDSDFDSDCLQYPSKKARTNMSRSLSRCPKSYASLKFTTGVYSAPPGSTCTVNTVSTDGSDGANPGMNPSLSSSSSSSQSSLRFETRAQGTAIPTQDSLLDQLHCVASSDSSDGVDAATIVDQVLSAGLVFPNLPATISETSCSINNLTQTSVQAAQVSETPTPPSINDGQHASKDSYGWFVSMDGDDDISDRATSDNVYRSLDKPKEDLSFSAVTAPKRSSDYDAEVEWAKAADTVDDVLGDFF